LRVQISALQDGISDTCEKISKEKEQQILIIIDDLDKLSTEFAETTFFKNANLLIPLKAKIIYTFPLDTYYRDTFMPTRDRYEFRFIPVINLYSKAGEYLDNSKEMLEKLILRRIADNLVTPEAMKYLIDMSGGLLRDLIKYMQDACKLAIVEKKDKIDLRIAELAINEHINDYYRVFDFSQYEDKVRAIANTKKKDDIAKLV